MQETSIQQNENDNSSVFSRDDSITYYPDTSWLANGHTSILNSPKSLISTSLSAPHDSSLGKRGFRDFRGGTVEATRRVIPVQKDTVKNDVQMVKKVLNKDTMRFRDFKREHVHMKAKEIHKKYDGKSKYLLVIDFFNCFMKFNMNKCGHPAP